LTFGETFQSELIGESHSFGLKGFAANRNLINLEFRGNDYGFRVALNSVP
jgi:hypothetical protein